MDLLDPILTWTSPVIVPETMMILAVVSSFLALFAAAVNSARVETVVTVPPLPPVVLERVLERCTVRLSGKWKAGTTYPPF